MKMDGLLERILEQNAAEKKARVFHYCSYWGTWSRILDNSNPLQVVELNLTPINPTTLKNWEEIPKFIIRTHGTAPGEKDRFEKELPSEVVRRMVENIALLPPGHSKVHALVESLLRDDIMSQIDLVLLKAKMIGGGVPLYKIQKGVCHSCGYHMSSEYCCSADDGTI